MRESQPHSEVLDVAVIGAGFSGLIAALTLKERPYTKFKVFERGARVGGVWRDNVYPGCACDIPANLYSISSRPNPDWCSSYSTQPEILAYLEATVERGGLGPHILLNWPVKALRFDAGNVTWEIQGERGDTYFARTVLAAIGHLNRPYIPAFSGFKDFAGTWFHSSAWDHTIPLKDKRVAVIGTGASAVQIVPALAGNVLALHVFQRSAPWIFPRLERHTSAARRAFYSRVPATQALGRAVTYWLHELVGLGILGNRAVRYVLKHIALYNLTRQVTGPELLRKLTPDHSLGCKRLLISNDFYPAFNLPDVHLVTSPIRAFTPHGIETKDGSHVPVDHVIFATGFTAADADGYLPIAGRNGRQIPGDWLDHGAQAFLGTTASGFPNLAFLLGPNSGPVGSSALHVVESQMQYVLAWLNTILSGDAGLDVRPDVQRDYNEHIQTLLQSTTWASGCRSWYIDRRGRNTTIYPGLTNSYRRRLKRFDLANYETVEPARRERRDTREPVGADPECLTLA